MGSATILIQNPLRRFVSYVNRRANLILTPKIKKNPLSSNLFLFVRIVFQFYTRSLPPPCSFLFQLNCMSRFGKLFKRNIRDKI